jgi:hypothetical protein
MLTTDLVNKTWINVNNNNNDKENGKKRCYLATILDGRMTKEQVGKGRIRGSTVNFPFCLAMMQDEP